MSCCSCKNLDTKKKVDGAVSGVRYYCKKNKAYVGGDFSCDKYTKGTRSTDEENKIFREGREWYNDDRPVGYYVLIFILVIIAFIIIYLFNPSLYGR